MSAVIRHITEADGIRTTRHIRADMSTTDTLEERMRATRAEALALKADLAPLHRVVTDEQTGFVAVMPRVSTNAQWDECEPASWLETALFLLVVVVGVVCAAMLAGVLWGMWL